MSVPSADEQALTLPNPPELQRLHRAAIIAYAARSALRALVFARFGKKDAKHAESVFRAVQVTLATCTARNAAEARRQVDASIAAIRVAVARAAAAAHAGQTAAERAATDVSDVAAYNARASAARIAAATADAAYATAHAAQASAERAADAAAAGVAAAVCTSRAADAITGSDAAQVTIAARTDYDMLLNTRADGPGTDFFAKPLWPGGHPLWWRKIRRSWHRSMKEAGHERLALQYDEWLQGTFDPRQMLLEVEQWHGQEAAMARKLEGAMGGKGE